jgi:hypothetical protein
VPFFSTKTLALAVFIVPTVIAQTVSFQTVSIMDDPRHIGGEAYRILAPAGWRVEGSVMWKNAGSDAASPWIKLIGPAQQEIGILPPATFLWNPLLLGSRYRAGSFYSGTEVQPPMLDPGQCIRSIIVPRYLRHLEHADVVKEEPLPALAQAGRLKYPESRYPTAAFQAGRIRFEFVEKGVPMEEDVYVLVVAVQTRTTQNVNTVWTPDEIRYSKGPKGTLDAQLPVLLTALFSLRPQLSWWARQQQVSEELGRLQATESGVPHGMQQQAAIADRMITKQKMAQEGVPINEELIKRYQGRQAVMNRLNSLWDSTAAQKLEVYRNPATGDKIALPSGYAAAWINQRLDIQVTGDAAFDPNSPPNSGWTRLEKAP